MYRCIIALIAFISAPAAAAAENVTGTWRFAVVSL